MNEYLQLSEAEKQGFNEALAKRNISQEKISEIIAYYNRYYEEHKLAEFSGKPVYAVVTVMAYFALAFSLLFAYQNVYADYVESWYTNGTNYLLFSSGSALSLIGLLFFIIALPTLFYFLPLKSLTNNMWSSKIFEFCYIAFREAKGQKVRYSFTIETKRIDSNFNSLPLNEAFERYIEKDIKSYKRIFIPTFVLSIGLALWGLSYYWVATKNGITFSSYYGNTQVTRSWKEVKEIKTACYTSRNSLYTQYTAVFNDLKEVRLNITGDIARFENLTIIDDILRQQNTKKSIKQKNDATYRFDSTCLPRLKEKYPDFYGKIIPVLGLENAAKRANFHY